MFEIGEAATVKAVLEGVGVAGLATSFTLRFCIFFISHCYLEISQFVRTDDYSPPFFDYFFYLLECSFSVKGNFEFTNWRRIVTRRIFFLA